SSISSGLSWMITTGRLSATMLLWTSRTHSRPRDDQLHRTRWSDISRVDTSRLLKDRSIRIEATLAVNRPARATPLTITTTAITRPANVLGGLFMPLNRVTQTFQSDSPQELNAGLLSRSTRYRAVPPASQMTTIAVRIRRT